MKIYLNEQLKSHQMKPSQKDNQNSTKNRVLFKKSIIEIPVVNSGERASAIFSLLLLLEHRDHWNWNDGFKVDWEDSDTEKWCITAMNEHINIINTFTNKKLLSFRNKESSMQFLETFYNLIDTAKDLI